LKLLVVVVESSQQPVLPQLELALVELLAVPQQLEREPELAQHLRLADHLAQVFQRE
jgi:hypothetical protein